MNPTMIRTRPQSVWRPLITGLLLFALPSKPITAAPQDASERETIEALAGEILTRMDAVDGLRSQREDAGKAVKRAMTALEKAEKDREIAEIAVEEYRRGAYPEELNTILAEIKLAEADLTRAKDRLAWSEKMLKRGSVSEASHLADKMSTQKCEISLLNAKKKKELLEQYTFEKEMTTLRATQKRALSEELSRKADLTLANNDVAKLDQRLRRTQLSEVETQALARLDEAIRLFEDGKPEPARVKLGEARAMWAQARFDAVKMRVRGAAEKVKAPSK